MTDRAIAYRGKDRDTAAGILVHTPDPATEAVAEIRRLLDDKRLSWAIWPAGRP